MTQQPNRQNPLSRRKCFQRMVQMLPGDRAQTAVCHLKADRFLDNEASHVFLFGSKSQEYLQPVLQNYSKTFDFSYSNQYWQIEDEETNEIYSVANPTQYKSGTDERRAAEQKDYAIIEKITDPDTGRVFFILAGLQDTGTRGAGEYLAKNWERLVKDYGAASFQILLQFAPGLGTQGAAVINRKIPKK